MALLASAAQQDNDVDQKQADEDEGEVDEQLLQVPLGLWVHFDLRRSADGRLGHVLHALHGDAGGLDVDGLAGLRGKRRVRLLGLLEVGVVARGACGCGSVLVLFSLLVVNRHYAWSPCVSVLTTLTCCDDKSLERAVNGNNVNGTKSRNLGL